MGVVNAWRLYQQANDEPMALLDFQRNIVRHYLACHAKAKFYIRPCQPAQLPEILMIEATELANKWNIQQEFRQKRQPKVEKRFDELLKELKQEYEARLKKIVKTGLNAINIARAVNSFAIPILTYSFGLVKWSDTELQQLDRKTRTTITKNILNHPKSAGQRVNLPRHLGGRGFINIRQMHNKQMSKMKAYFAHFRIATSNTDWSGISSAIRVENTTIEFASRRVAAFVL
ncbi:unnamed protein product [Acanthoscelides obtectus]|uniref:Uncharacterized protein n=1 Tax=Acanthoscelides obtectus TaxID=200917 RepID=A0A9P0KFN1_ACAOB|nr:unnamed protein product [Acanthoscelides obtectus]CAK1680319.1 hypothetical protein AOBTE_LOCUS32576 [Acanthoscelides obtectus]